MRSQPPCKIWAEKLALRREALAPADREAVDAHVQPCPACEAPQADYHFLDPRLRALPPPALKPLPRLSLQNLRQDEGERDTTKTMKAGGCFVFPVRNSLPAALIARLILAAVLLLFGLQSASNNGSQSQRTTLFTYDAHSIYHGHSGFVDAVSWSPNGQYIASGDRNDTVQVWNVKTGKQLFEYPRYTGGIIEALAWSPDGRYIAAGDRDGTVHVLDAHRGSLLLIYKGYANQVSALAWSPNSRYIASGSYDHTVQVWNAQTGATLSTYRGHSNTVAAVAWSPNSRYIASGSWDGTVQVWAAPSTR